MSMKNIKWLLGAFSMLLAMTTFTACSDDDDKLEVPVFPESVVLNCQPGENESAELVFTANQPWTLASSKLWCKFSVDGELQNSLAGKAGEQKVQIIATDDVWDFENSLAEITLSMGGQTQAIAVVNRSANTRDLKMYQDIEHPFGEENPATLKYSVVGISLENISVVANFDWEIQRYPEWISIDGKYRVGKAGKTSVIALDFAENADVRYPLEAGDINNKIVFVNKDGQEYSIEIPVAYEGMPEDAVQFPMNTYGWTFSQDGSQYWTASLSGEEVEKKEAPMKLQVITRDDEYKTVCLSFDEKWGYTPLDEWSTWIYPEKDEQDVRNISISVRSNEEDMMTGNSGDPRKGMVLVLPSKKYEELGGDMNNLFDDLDGFFELKAQYTPYILVDFTQEGKEAIEKGGFIIEGLPEGEDPVKVEVDPDKYGTSNVWAVALDHTQAYENLQVTGAGCDIIMPECANPWTGARVESWGGNMWGLTVPAYPEAQTPPMVVTIKEYAQDDMNMEHGEIVSVLLIEQY